MIRIFRALVRGEFCDLDEPTKVALRAKADEHDHFHSSFTADGTLLYGPQIHWFNLRYELRFDDEAGVTEERVQAEALRRAVAFLDAEGLGYKRIRADEITDMASIWDDG